jgi:cytidylate kinase
LGYSDVKEKGDGKMAVITISRKVGSGGDYIAREVAQNLGYHFVDKDFIGTLLREYGLSFERVYDNLPSFWEKFIAQKAMKEEKVSMLNRAIRALAHHGNVVILGRSGFVVLGDLVDVLNVRIQAPIDFRVNQMMKREEVSKEEAEALIKQGDKVRSDFVETFYGVQWETSSAFDLVINTRKVAPALAISWLVESVNAIEAKEEDEKPAAATIEVDSWMAKSVAEEFDYITAQEH